MKTAEKSLLLIAIVGIMLIVSLDIVQARFRRGGSDTYYDFRTCTDGIEITIAINNGQYDANNPPTLDGILLLDGSAVLSPTVNIDSLELITPTVFIPGLPSPDIPYWMGSPIASWITPTLRAGSRVSLQLEVPNTTVIPNIYTTVEDCSATDPAPPDSYIESQGIQKEIPGSGVPVTSTITVDSGHQPIGDVNVAMHVNYDPLGSPLTADFNLQASLTAPDGTTKVELFNVAASKDYAFGSRCELSTGSGPLIGDDKADFVLDDDSVFQFGDPEVTSPFINTAVKPTEPLSSFFNQDPTGTWELELINQSGNNESLYVICWYLEIEDAPTCYELTLSHTGTGSDPTASPTHSTGCTTGEYVEGASINVTAYPDPGHHVGSWAGTNNDASTASTNVVSMSASTHTVTANYVEGAPTCYALTLSNTGSGSQPTALPANSTGCDTGEYVAGESIDITAYPDTGHHVDSWTGTNNDASTGNTNVVSMPAGDHTVTANYVEDSAKYPIYLPAILKN